MTTICTAIMKKLKGLHRDSGQAGTEYMLVVSVCVVAVVAAAYTFVPSFTTGVTDLASDVSVMLDEHRIASDTMGGYGNDRNAAVKGSDNPFNN